MTPAHMAELLGLLDDRTAVGAGSPRRCWRGHRAPAPRPRTWWSEKGLGQISDEGELIALVERLLADNPAQAQQLRDGKDKLVGFFVGQAMKATGGKADPARVGELVRERTAWG